MGEVYRARDGKLHREVAIKVLPAEESKAEHEIVMLQNFFDELRRKVPVDRLR